MSRQPQRREPQQFYQQHGTPRNGPGGTLAGTAEPGDRLDVGGETGGSFVNNGTKAVPMWQRIGTAPPASKVGSWSSLIDPDEWDRRNRPGLAGDPDWWKPRG
jgi:hypothetical protein